MSRNFFDLSSTYLEKVPDKVIRRNRIIVEYLDKNYLVNPEVRYEIITRLNKDGLAIKASTLGVALRAYRNAFIYLSRQEEEVEERYPGEITDITDRLKEGGRADINPLRYLLNDGIDSWKKVEALWAKEEKKVEEEVKVPNKVEIKLSLAEIGNRLAWFVERCGPQQLEEEDDEVLVDNLG